MNKNPFPGLRPFEANETHVFFGREGQSNELLRRLQHARFLAVVGTSGSGKSSLVRAGLLPVLHGGLMSGVGSDWHMAILRPGNNPIGNMAEALMAPDVLGSRTGADAQIEAAIAETTLRRGSRGLIELVKQARIKTRDGEPVFSEGENLLIVVDQFEEIFRIIEQFDELVRVRQLAEKETGDKSGVAAAADTADLTGRHPKEDAAAFVKLLLEATQRNDDGQYEENIYVILTMRSDYLGDSAQFWDLPEAINDGQYLIPRMTRDQRREAIIGPVGVARGEISEPLVNELLNDAGENPDHLPTLQHVLMRMWDVWAQAPSENGGGLNLGHYKKIGRMSGALSNHANEAFEELPEEQRPLAEKVFKCLTEKGLDNRETRRPMTLSDICEVVNTGEEQVKEVIGVFRAEGRSFLMPPPRIPLEGDTLIDISHESLIRGWDKLAAWVDEEAESARTYKRLADTALLKEAGKEDYYSGPALQLALKWREDSAPNEAWAQRYHPAFEKAIAFLDSSLANSQEKEQIETARLEKELKQARELVEEKERREAVQADAAKRRKRYIVGLAFLTVATLATSGLALAYQQRALAQETRQLEQVKRLRDEAVAARTVADEERNKATSLAAEAKAAKDVAEGLQKQAEEQAGRLTISLQNEQKAKQEAITLRAAAQRERDEARRLQGENQEQARIYGYFKTAFDEVAAGDSEKAAASLGKALEYFTSKKDTANIISTHINIGDVYRGSENPFDSTNAIESYDAAIELIKAGKGDDKLLVSTLEKAASVGADSENNDEMQASADYYEQAAAVYNKLGQKDNESARWFDIGKIFSRSDDIENNRKAASAFERASKVHYDGGAARDAGKAAEVNANIGGSYEKLVEAMTAEETDDEVEEKPVTTGGEETPAVNSQSQKVRREDNLRRLAADYFGEASRFYSQAGNKLKVAEMWDKVGSVLGDSKTMDFKERAAKAFETAADAYARAGEEDLRVSSLISAGNIFRAAEDRELWSRAEKFYISALAVHRGTGNREKEAQTLNQIGSAYTSSDAPEQKQQAINYYKEAARIYRDMGNKGAEVSTLIAAAAVSKDIEGEKAHSDAVELYRQAVMVYENDPPNQVATHIRIGRALGRTSDEAQAAWAASYFKDAVELAQKHGGKKAAAAAHLDVGVASQSLRNRRLAIPYYEQALALYKEIDDTFGQGMALYRLSAIYNVFRDTRPKVTETADSSLAFLSRAIPGLELSNDKKSLADGHYAMGALYRQKKDYEKALASFQKALPLYRSLPDQRLRVTTTNSVINSLKRQMGQEK
jgi:tetratricopeptide (TPR) repeat protein